MVFRIPEHHHSLLTFGGTSLSRLPLGELKILVWNVWKGKRGEAWRRDFLKLASDRHLVLIQEAVSDNSMSDLLHGTKGRHEWHMAASFEWSFSHKTGVATGAVASPSGRHFIRGSERELFVWTPKISLSTLFDREQGEPLLVINTHVVNFTTTASFVRFVEELVRTLEAHKGPLILAGDFNTWNFKRWLSLLEILAKMGVEPISFGDDPRWLKLDHVFVRGLKPRLTQIRDDIESSDHFPLLVDFEPLV